MIKDLIKLANRLDSKGLAKEADYLDSIIQKEAKKKKRRSPTKVEERGIERPFRKPWEGMEFSIRGKDKRDLAREELSAKLSKFDEEKREESVDPFIENQGIEYALQDVGRYISFLKSKAGGDPKEIVYDDYVVEVMERDYPRTTALNTEDQINMFSDYANTLRTVYEANKEKIHRGL